MLISSHVDSSQGRQEWKRQEDSKLEYAWKDKRVGKNIDKAFHAFLCALTGKDPNDFFFSEDNGLEGEASGSDDEVDNGYCSEVSNTLNDWTGYTEWAK